MKQTIYVPHEIQTFGSGVFCKGYDDGEKCQFLIIKQNGEFLCSLFHQRVFGELRPARLGPCFDLTYSNKDKGRKNHES